MKFFSDRRRISSKVVPSYDGFQHGYWGMMSLPSNQHVYSALQIWNIYLTSEVWHFMSSGALHGITSPGICRLAVDYIETIKGFYFRSGFNWCVSSSDAAYGWIPSLHLIAGRWTAYLGSILWLREERSKTEEWLFSSTLHSIALWSDRQLHIEMTHHCGVHQHPLLQSRHSQYDCWFINMWRTKRLLLFFQRGGIDISLRTAMTYFRWLPMRKGTVKNEANHHSLEGFNTSSRRHSRSSRFSTNGHISEYTYITLSVCLAHVLCVLGAPVKYAAETGPSRVGLTQQLWYCRQSRVGHRPTTAASTTNFFQVRLLSWAQYSK
jgi:hypothetical protein